MCYFGGACFFSLQHLHQPALLACSLCMACNSFSMCCSYIRKTPHLLFATFTTFIVFFWVIKVKIQKVQTTCEKPTPSLSMYFFTTALLFFMQYNWDYFHFITTCHFLAILSLRYMYFCDLEYFWKQYTFLTASESTLASGALGFFMLFLLFSCFSWKK